MRKFYVVLALLLCLAGLSGCAEDVNWALPVSEEARIMNERHPEVLSREESMAMARYMCANRVYVTENALYTLDFDVNTQPVLAAYERDGTELSGFKILAGDCVPLWLTAHEGRLYYVNAWANGYIESVDIASGERRIVAQKHCSYLSVDDGKLFYRNERGAYCRAETDGSGETVLLDKNCCYVWRWGEAILYQSEEDGERLRLFWPEDGTDICLTAGAAYAPLLLGDRLWFTEGGRLRSMGIDGTELRDYESRPITGAAEFIAEGESWLARCVTDDYGIDQWTLSLSDGNVREVDYKGYRCCDYIDESCRVDAVYFSDGRLRDFELICADGQSIRYINKWDKLSGND